MKQKTGVKQTRQRYSDEFKEQALRRAEQEGGDGRQGFEATREPTVCLA